MSSTLPGHFSDDHRTHDPSGDRTDPAPDDAVDTDANEGPVGGAEGAREAVEPDNAEEAVAPDGVVVPGFADDNPGADATEGTPDPVVLHSTQPDVTAPELKRNELYDRVAERSGTKRRDVKPVVNALLAVLGETLAEGRGMNLEPMGKLRINRIQDKAKGRTVVCKVRQQGDATEGGNDPLAEPGETG
ncbi:HU family DNA-binding protein [Marinibacterium sp. SX1]|uniref:HU family DNA-binding protein n=1 Tax=Marinibacterium sp. SX1 TaxID=3388424 RepID=UPI003D165B8A